MISKAQYDAILEIAQNGERFKASDLNIRTATVAAIAKRGWIEVVNGHAFVTDKAWSEIAA